MPNASPESIIDLPPDKGGFLSQLPQRLAAVEENWAELRNTRWDVSELDNLYRRLREISEASSRFGLGQLNENVFAFEVYLSSFVGSNERPEEAQLEAIDGLLRNMMAAGKGCLQDASNAGAERTRTIYLLESENSDDTHALEHALNLEGVTCRVSNDVEKMLLAMGDALPSCIVVDSSHLPKLSPLSAELIRLKSSQGLEIPLVFTSASSTLQLRVDAIRAGGNAYFVRPFDDVEVARQIIKLADASMASPYRVLVVEDDPTQAEFAASILRKANMEVKTVIEPMKVLDELQGFTPDLILMDIYMPEINGIELTTVIREYNEFVSIPIIFLSGEQNADKQFDALSVGGDDFVAKPIRPKHLLAVVENRVRRARQLSQAMNPRKPHDRVTGLLTHERFAEQVARAIDADPTHAHPAGILAIKFDQPESLQERLGIGGVDDLTVQLSNLLQEALEDSDPAGKLNGSTIGLLIKRSSNNRISELANLLQQKAAAHTFNTQVGKVQATISIGICLFDENIDNASGLIRRAENALVTAQANGNGQSHIHTFSDEADGDGITSADDMTASIRHCLSQDSFVVRYQPLLDLMTRGSENYEVILRIPTPSGDLLREKDIREPAEQANLSGDIDRWLLERAIDILKQRRESGRQTHIFVRQSATSLLDPNHPAWLLGRLRTQQMVGTGLVLDFRLPDLSSDIKAAHKHIAALKEFDVEVSLSRFPEKPAAFKVLRFVGAQYISVAPRLLKADRAVISEVIEQSHKLGVKVIVANIDDPRSIDLHWSSGADFLQGNFIQRQLDNMDYDFSQVVI